MRASLIFYISLLLFIGLTAVVMTACTNPFAADENRAEATIKLTFQAPLLQRALAAQSDTNQVPAYQARSARYIVDSARSAVVQVVGQNNDFSVRRTVELSRVGDTISERQRLLSGYYG